MNDEQLIREWWGHECRDSFHQYRRYINHKLFKTGWFARELSQCLQQFYEDYTANKKPILLISVPPQHGKSWGVTDFLAWFLGKQPQTKIIYASFSERLGVRANRSLQRHFDTEKYKDIFPNFEIGERRSGQREKSLLRNNEIIETSDLGFFRNTTVNGAVTGETLDLGVIDDPVKGRAEAKSPTVKAKVWDWFTDDFYSRFSENAGLILIMTRWDIEDLAGLIQKEYPESKVIEFKAIAEEDEQNRKEGEALFPDLKSKDFLEKRKKMLAPASWQSLYQQSPIVIGGEMVKDEWWEWWTVPPKIKYKIIVADTAQKTNNWNDYSCLHCWGIGFDGRLYLLDKLRGKFEAPDLLRESEMFYNKHNTKRKNINDPILRGFYIEDKSSGTGLIQTLKKKKLKIVAIPRNNDKISRMLDCIPYIESKNVVLNADIEGVDNLTHEARLFPNGTFDDDIDTAMSAIEIVFLTSTINSSLQAAMES